MVLVLTFNKPKISIDVFIRKNYLLIPMGRIYLYKIWFTSTCINPFLLLFLNGVFSSKHGQYKIEKCPLALKLFIQGLIQMMAGLFWVPIIVICSLPILWICRVAQYYLAQTIHSEIWGRIWILLIVVILSLSLGLGIGRSISDGVRFSVICSFNVFFASIYHSFRDRLDSYA